MIVELSTHGSALRRRRDRFIVETKKPDGERDQTEIPADKIDAIMITANAMISTQAAKLCIEKQIQLVMSSYGGKPFARIWSSTSGKATEIRRLQYLNSDTEMSLEVSRDIVLEKLKGQRRLVLDLKNNRTRTGDDAVIRELQETAELISQTRGKIKALEVSDVKKPALLGFEGACAARYFAALSSCLPKKWQFERRSQNPGLDPFNASLNYMYGMAYSTVEKTIILSGLDPHAGFYHVDSYGKPTLAFDIIEVCRPMVDKTLVSLFNKRMVREDWFEREVDDSEEAGVRIAKDGRKTLLSSYYKEDVKMIEKRSWEYCRKIIGMLTEDGGDTS